MLDKRTVSEVAQECIIAIKTLGMFKIKVSHYNIHFLIKNNSC